MPARLLPLISTPGAHGGRSRMTCTYKCGNACDHPEPNTSCNPHIGEVLARAVARRSVLGGAMAGTQRGKVLQFLTVPRGAECCGPLITKNGRTAFAAIQHPGEIDGATFEDPASTWPHTNRYPIPTVVVAFRVDGQRIGR